jgi:hypothetical protein
VAGNRESNSLIWYPDLLHHMSNIRIPYQPQFIKFRTKALLISPFSSAIPARALGPGRVRCSPLAAPVGPPGCSSCRAVVGEVMMQSARAPGLAKAQISLVVRLTPQKDMVKWLIVAILLTR